MTPIPKNNPEDVNACEKIIKKEPTKPKNIWLKKPIKEKFIWDTEEYAIIFLISIWLKAVNEGKLRPIKAINKI